MKKISFNEGDFNLTIERYRKEASRLAELMSLWEQISNAKPNKNIFEAVVAANTEGIQAIWDVKVGDEVGKITLNPSIAADLRAKANEPFNDFCKRMNEVRQGRERKAWETIRLNDERFTFSGGIVGVDEKAVKEDFTLYMSEEGERLYQLAQEAFEKLNLLQSELKKLGHSPEVMQVLNDEFPASLMTPAIISGRTQNAVVCFSQMEGKIRINEEFFANV